MESQIVKKKGRPPKSIDTYTQLQYNSATSFLLNNELVLEHLFQKEEFKLLKHNLAFETKMKKYIYNQNRPKVSTK